MKHPMRSLGLTLVELMAVVGIIALLSGIAGFFVMGNRENRARTDLLNDVETLLHTQRTRATSMNVATYVRFVQDGGGGKVTSIEPRIGDVSTCVANENNQHVIRYQADENTPVGIDLLPSPDGTFRALDSINSSKYARQDGETIVDLNVQRINIIGNSADYNNTFVVCFQPNGQAKFMTDGAFLEGVAKAQLQITRSEMPEQMFVIHITGLGTVHSNSLLLSSP